MRDKSSAPEQWKDYKQSRVNSPGGGTGYLSGDADVQADRRCEGRGRFLTLRAEVQRKAGDMVINTNICPESARITNSHVRAGSHSYGRPGHMILLPDEWNLRADRPRSW
ncbi:hypothetical protein J6590_030054 [Homalodisca vitripennis]|nr:hypothetical protein J6590_030054 [Homalodisca vitripennis]